ncbi:MAG: DUF3365 domain-containing protein, partial [Nitrospinota bacterium]|nr:DUF3365 domain-containing protein [Nitrospinota bacterium]
PLIQDIDTCIDCHEKEWDMADSKHGSVPCEDCHQSPGLHAQKSEKAPTDDEVAKTEAQTIARLSFQSILAVMSQGWDKKEIDRFLALQNEGKTGISIRLFRGAVVAKQFGQREGEAAMLKQAPDILEAMADGKERLITDEKNVRYIYPLIADKKCLECHTASAVGDVQGALEVALPVASLALKRYRKLAPMSIDRSREACQICHERLSARPKGFPQVEDFDKHITKGWKAALGPVDVKARCVTCHKPHFPAMVKSKES